MKTILAFVVLLLPTLARADAPPAPADRIEPGKLLIVPFDQIGGDSSQRFISRAIEQSLLSQLVRPGVLRPIESKATTQPAEAITAQSAMQLGLSQGAEFVLFGSYQFAGSDLRIIGQVVSSGSGAVVANLRSTGPVRDLFAMEDTIAEQAKRALIPPGPSVASAPQPLPPAAAPVSTPDNFEGSALQRSLITGRDYNRNNFQNDYNRYYNNPYPTPYYGYPYSGVPYYTGGYGYYPHSGFGGYVFVSPTTRRSR